MTVAERRFGGNATATAGLSAAKREDRDLAGLEALLDRAGEKRRGPAPVEKWDPPFSGDLDMEIRPDGRWFYMGTPISRKALVDLFATVLRKDEDGETYLVTPVEKFRIRVVDAAFLAVEMHAGTDGDRQVLTFRTNTGDVVEAGPDNPLRFVIDPDNQGIRPYVLIRGRLEALLGRAVTHELMSLGEEVDADGTRSFAIRSNGEVFCVMSMEAMERLAGEAQ